jgi:hypothetical protein
MAEAFLWFLMGDDFRSISGVFEILHISSGIAISEHNSSIKIIVIR